MCTTNNALSPTASVPSRFLAILPRIQQHAVICFRHVRCPSTKDDCIVETIALAWKWFQRLLQRGKDASHFVSTFATFATRAVRSGRRACGTDKPNDVLSPRAQRQRNFEVRSLRPCQSHGCDDWLQSLQDNTQTPVLQQVCFRCDFPARRRRHQRRDRLMIADMMKGLGTKALSRKYGLSPARISQKRREFHDDWKWFCADPAERD